MHDVYLFRRVSFTLRLERLCAYNLIECFTYSVHFNMCGKACERTHTIMKDDLYVYQLLIELEQHARPPIPPAIASRGSVADLLRMCWDEDPSKRPTFSQVCASCYSIDQIEL